MKRLLLIALTLAAIFTSGPRVRARAEEARLRASEARGKRSVALALGLGTGVGSLAGQGLRIAGFDTVGSALSGAADSAREIGTMLSPLGAEAAAAGAAVGALTGGLKALAESMTETRRAAEAAKSAVRDMNADTVMGREELAELERTDPDAAAKRQHEMQEELRRLSRRSELGGRVDMERVADFATYDPATVRRIVGEQRSRGTMTGPKAQALEAALSYDENARNYRLATEAADSAWWFGATKYRNRASGYRAMMDLAETSPELIAAFGQGKGAEGWKDRAEDPNALARYGAGNRATWSAALDARWREMEEERLALRNPAKEEAPDTKGLALSRIEGGRADSLGSMGLGYAGSPMRETEKLRREIRDDARRAAKKPAAPALIG